ncbi:unnamed protein product [Aureobasidium vineae]|uniref:Uncharacterized protein n=1 Tax=Aureobasidium vineae TaxID=2773715 RepID=A0A9N8JTT6_9PEZI|nr:unnamed protein product [Aureobasidium vineae]
MSHDFPKAAGQRFNGHHMATTNPFSLPTRPASQWEDTRDRTSEQLHESAMYQFGLARVPSTSTSTTGSNKTRATHASDPFETMHQKWEERGWLIQKHERRLKDSNKLLSKMWRRLDPYGRVLELLENNMTVRRHAERRAEPAFSEHHAMQDLFYQLAAYDYVHAIDPSLFMAAPASHTDPALTERRLNSLASTVKIQSGLLQEKNDTTEKLRTQLDTQRRSHLQQLSAHQKDGDDALDRLEKQLQKANTKISRLMNTPPMSKPIAAPRAPRPRPSRAPIAKTPVAKASVVKAPVVKAPVAKDPVVKLPETAFGGAPENHTSLTFEGFSEHNTFNPARLLMLTAVNPPSERATSMTEDDFDVGPLSSGANCAPLGPPKKRYDSAMQSSRSSQAPTPMSFQWLSGGDAPNHVERVGPKRAVSFLNYDDPEDEPEDTTKDCKRLKSGALTPPLPEDLVMASTEETGGGVPIKHETDLEMGEVEEARGGNKYAYEDLDEMIDQAQTKAMD